MRREGRRKGSREGRRNGSRDRRLLSCPCVLLLERILFHIQWCVRTEGMKEEGGEEGEEEEEEEKVGEEEHCERQRQKGFWRHRLKEI